jgi:hypothetical protein
MVAPSQITEMLFEGVATGSDQFDRIHHCDAAIGGCKRCRADAKPAAMFVGSAQLKGGTRKPVQDR